MEAKQNHELKDEIVWSRALQRTKFKSNLVSYLTINGFLILIWWLGDQGHFWPKWVLLFWGLALFIQFCKAYLFQEELSAEREYDKLMNQQNRM